MVTILMSIYNGAKYMREQIDSILAQTYTDFHLIIRDDGSTENVRSIIESYSDLRITYIEGENQGPCKSFFSLLTMASDAQYIFFSDQDDVWYPNKIETMLTEIRMYNDEPAMVFSDFSMIDENGNQTNESYAQYAHLRIPSCNVGVEQLIPQPYVFGCASVINRKLADIVCDPPEGIEMHDCWIALTAASVGKLIYLPKQTIAHRFHSSNVTGKNNQTKLTERIKRTIFGFSNQAQNTALRLHQVNLLLDSYKGRLIPHAETILIELSKAMAAGKCKTVATLRKMRIGRQKTVNTLFFYITVLGIRGEIK